ncbi:hypothetical protein GCM10011411_26440 [Aurantiacibacter arachoides]|nr:hypothetical protein GCM10011411_26440 [Aurantiacibacter arachoides]
MHWHHAAKKMLIMYSLTADPLPEPYTRDGITTLPFMPFFHRFSPEEFVELYRISRPKYRQP